MKTIKMTKSDKANNLLAGLVYELSNKDAKRYLDDGTAILVKEEQEQAQELEDGDR